MFAGHAEQTLDEIDIGSASPSPLISTRNDVPNGRPLCTTPFYRTNSALRKAGAMTISR